MFTEEDKKRYLIITKHVYEMIDYFKLDIYSKISYNITEFNTGYSKSFNNIGSLVQYLYDNHLMFLSFDAYSDCNGNIDTLAIRVIPDISTTIKASVFEILKDFGNKKTPEFKQQLENAILNGHITFKQYNELYKLTKVNGGKTL